MTWVDWILVAYSLAAFVAGMFFGGAKTDSSRPSLEGARRLENTNPRRESA